MVDRLIMVQGRVRMRDDRGVPQLWADRVTPFESSERHLSAVVVNLAGDVSDDGPFERLVELAGEHPGSAMLYLRPHKENGSPRLIWIKEHKVRPCNEFVLELRKVFGDRAVELRGELPPVENGYRRGRRGRGSRS
jgi:hypothetical protein